MGLEACQGVFQASGGALRSRHFPDALQSSLLSVFRIPLNLLVVIGTRITANADASVGDDISSADSNSNSNPLWPAFLAAGCMHLCALFCQFRLLSLENSVGNNNKTKNTKGVPRNTGAVSPNKTEKNK